MSATVNIRSDELEGLQQSIEALGGGLTGEEIRLVMGNAAKEVIKDHFAQLSNDEAHHRSARSLGATPTGYFARASDATHDPQLENEGVSISIDLAGIAQRLFGGTIEARPGSFLTIPARTEAYGKRARDFTNLRLIIFPSGAGALVERDATVARGGKGGRQTKLAGSLGGTRKGDAIGGGVYYWLVRSVTQGPDPSVLPADEEILEPAIRNAQRYIETLLEKRAA